MKALSPETVILQYFSQRKKFNDKPLTHFVIFRFTKYEHQIRLTCCSEMDSLERLRWNNVATTNNPFHLPLIIECDVNREP